MVDNADRCVHAYTDQMEIVRYERAGKWYLEPKIAGLPRQRVTVQQAADYFFHAYEAVEDGTVGYAGVEFGRPGGRRFDFLVKQRQDREAGS
jgi:hypothetical protein